MKTNKKIQLYFYSVLILIFLSLFSLSGNAASSSLSGIITSNPYIIGISNLTGFNPVIPIIPTEGSCAKQGTVITVGTRYTQQCCAGLRAVSLNDQPMANGICPKILPIGGHAVCLPCGNKVCDTSLGENSCNCPSDCAPLQPIITEPYCGDGICNSNETWATCPEDCLKPTPTPYCGDGICNSNETWATCPEDCLKPTPTPYCGDGMCNSNETWATCPEDCLKPTPTPYCGDGMCNSNETWATCPEDCLKPAAPVTSISPNGHAWTNKDVPFIFLCSDSIGCNATYYRIINSDSSCPVGNYIESTSGTVSIAAGIAASESVCFFSVNTLGVIETPKKSNSFLLDKKNPETTAKITESDGSAYVLPQWSTSGLKISLSCSDFGDSGCAYTKYCIGKSDCNPDITYSSSISYNSLGTNYLRFYSVDNASNIEQTKQVVLNIDNSFPQYSGFTYSTIGCSASGYTERVEISWSDPYSGISKVILEINASGVLKNYTMTKGPGNLYYYDISVPFSSVSFKSYATNIAGKTASAKMNATFVTYPSTTILFLNGSDSDLTALNNGSITLESKSSVSGLTTSLYLNTAKLSSGSGNVPYTLSLQNLLGTYKIKAVTSSGCVNNKYYTQSKSDHTLTVSSVPLPEYRKFTYSITGCSATGYLARAQIEWNDSEYALSKVMLETNASGVLKNYTMTKGPGNLYYYDIPVPFSSVSFKSYATNIAGKTASAKMNATFVTYPSTTTLFLNGSDSDLTALNNGSITLESKSSVSSLYTTLFLNKTKLVSTEGIANHTLALSNLLGTYSITAVTFSGCVNNKYYTQSQSEHTLNVSAAPKPPANTCQDSDSGVNYFTQGSISGYQNNMLYKKTDYCVNSSVLREYYCSNATIVGGYTYTDYTCQNGCSNGMCIRAEPTPTPTPKPTPTPLIKTYNGLDGVLVPYVRVLRASENEVIVLMSIKNNRPMAISNVDLSLGILGYSSQQSYTISSIGSGSSKPLYYVLDSDNIPSSEYLTVSIELDGASYVRMVPYN